MEYVIDLIAFMVLMLGAAVDVWITTSFDFKYHRSKRWIVNAIITVLTVMAMNLVVAIIVHLGHFPYNHFLFPFVGE